MTKQQIELIRVQKAIAKNSLELKNWNQYAIMSEIKIKTVESQIEYQEKLFKDRIDKMKLAIERAVKNAKLSHATLDKLIKEKEELHLELKAAIHLGQVQCEHCLKYYTPQGIVRHRNTCSAKPEIIVVEQHKEEIVEVKDDYETKKAALIAELEDMAKKQKAKE